MCGEHVSPLRTGPLVCLDCAIVMPGRAVPSDLPGRQEAVVPTRSWKATRPKGVRLLLPPVLSPMLQSAARPRAKSRNQAARQPGLDQSRATCSAKPSPRLPISALPTTTARCPPASTAFRAHRATVCAGWVRSQAIGCPMPGRWSIPMERPRACMRPPGRLPRLSRGTTALRGNRTLSGIAGPGTEQEQRGHDFSGSRRVSAGTGAAP